MTIHEWLRTEIALISSNFLDQPGDDVPLDDWATRACRLDSLDRISLIVAAEDHFEIELPDEALPDPLTINTLAEVIRLGMQWERA
jgi:acyl carrier protein